MATNREMLKEAIADAKAVKETAIANAKVALEEAFTPQLKSMFAAKLQEMEIEEEKIEEYGMEHDTASIKDMDKDGDTDVQDAAMMEVDLEELLRELELEEDDTLNEAEEDGR
jgi:spore coat protein CotF